MAPAYEGDDIDAAPRRAKVFTSGRCSSAALSCWRVQRCLQSLGTRKRARPDGNRHSGGAVAAGRARLQHAPNQSTETLIAGMSAQRNLFARCREELMESTPLRKKQRDTSRVPRFATIDDASAASREFIEVIIKQCGIAHNVGDGLPIRALNDCAICRLGKTFKRDVFMNSVPAALGSCKR